MRRKLFGQLAGLGAFIAAVGIGGCEVGHPFRGPRYDRERGVVNVAAGRLLVVAITQGDVAGGGGRQFNNALRAVLDGMDAHEGLVGYAVRRQLFGSRVWTMSVWTDHASLRKFLASPDHRSAVENGKIPRASLVSAQVEVPAEQVPFTWSRAKAILADNARKEGTR